MKYLHLQVVSDVGFVTGDPLFEQVDRKTRQTLSPIVYVDPYPGKYSDRFRELFFESVYIDGRRFDDAMVVGSGFYSDGATIPSPFEWIVKKFGVERFGRFYLPSVLHDKIYESLWSGLHGGDMKLLEFFSIKQEGDWLFEDALALNGVSEFSSNVAYIVVRELGYIEWNKKKENGYYE